MNETTEHDLKQRFHDDGFVSVPQFMSGQTMVELIANVDRFTQNVVGSMPSEHVFHEDKNHATTLKQIQQMGNYDPWFDELFTNSRFRGMAETLLEGPVVPRNLQYFNKPPGVGQPTPPHQHGYYFMLDPCEAVTMWFALDEVDEENGCVRYVRGSHQQAMREHARTPTLGFSQGIVDYPNDADREMEVKCPARPGDLLVHHALTIHRAERNRSATRTRRSLGFIYYSERAREDAGAHAEYQRKLAADLKATGRI